MRLHVGKHTHVLRGLISTVLLTFSHADEYAFNDGVYLHNCLPWRRLILPISFQLIYGILIVNIIIISINGYIND